MSILKKLSQYRFEIRHLMIIFAALAIFQTILSYINKTASTTLLSTTMELYKQDSAENLADLTATSLELLIEHEMKTERSENSKKITIQEINIILTQQTLRQHVEEISLILERQGKLYQFNDGLELYEFYFDKIEPSTSDSSRSFQIDYFNKMKSQVMNKEQIYSHLDEGNAFHVLVPFVPIGEISGTLYMKILPDFSNIANEISSAYNETGAVFSALILLSLLAVFFATSYSLRERDLAQNQLFNERQEGIRKEIEHEQEAHFTKRIYHAHHKAEKVMGFIKEDSRALDVGNIDAVKDKIIKYANFVSRIIYDMKSYEPRVEIVRNTLFNTQINDVINFLVKNIFGRVFKSSCTPNIQLKLDANLPTVPINEYVIWEILEPLIQNSIDHNKNDDVQIIIETKHNNIENKSFIVIEDNGEGIKSSLLKIGKDGIKQIFLENTSTKDQKENSGYGCYIAYEICTQRCNWKIDAQNNTEGGARFMIEIPH
jgi:signal transduction histidine kinase